MSTTRHTLRRLALAVASLVAAGHALQAHHSFAMFDTTRRVALVGSVATFQWTNPHVIIEVDVPDANGTIELWTIELGSPSILMRGGWTFKDLKRGDTIALVVNPLRQGDHGGLLVQVTLPDGRVLGNGAPPSSRGR